MYFCIYFFFEKFWKNTKRFYFVKIFKKKIQKDFCLVWFAPFMDEDLG